MNEVEGNPVCGSGDYKKKKKSKWHGKFQYVKSQKILDL